MSRKAWGSVMPLSNARGCPRQARFLERGQQKWTPLLRFDPATYQSLREEWLVNEELFRTREKNEPQARGSALAVRPGAASWSSVGGSDATPGFSPSNLVAIGESVPG